MAEAERKSQPVVSIGHIPFPDIEDDCHMTVNGDQIRKAFAKTVIVTVGIYGHDNQPGRMLRIRNTRIKYVLDSPLARVRGRDNARYKTATFQKITVGQAGRVRTQLSYDVSGIAINFNFSR